MFIGIICQNIDNAAKDDRERLSKLAEEKMKLKREAFKEKQKQAIRKLLERGVRLN